MAARDQVAGIVFGPRRAEWTVMQAARQRPAVLRTGALPLLKEDEPSCRVPEPVVLHGDAGPPGASSQS